MRKKELDNLSARGQQPKVFGLPTLDLDNVGGMVIPTDWQIKSVMGDIIMAEYIDENDQGEVFRGGIWLKQEVTNKMWRVAKVIKIGAGCYGQVKEGDLIMFPSDKGLKMVNFDKRKYVFLNEERIFAVVEARTPA